MSLRGKIIFGAALIFAARTAVRPDLVSLLGTFIFLSSHYLDRFFSSERVDSKALKKVAELEEDIKRLRDDISSVRLAQGMRGTRVG